MKNDDDCNIEKAIIIPKNTIELTRDFFLDCKNTDAEIVIFEEDSATKTIKSETFSLLPNIKKIIIPASVSRIEMPLSLGSSFMGFEVDENNDFFTSIDGVLYSKDMQMMISYPQGKKDTSFTVIDYVCDICSFCFSDCPYLEQVIFTVDSEVNLIDKMAFFNLPHLKSIVFPSYVRWIDFSFLRNCPSLEEYSFAALSENKKRELIINEEPSMKYAIEGPFLIFLTRYIVFKSVAKTKRYDHRLVLSKDVQAIFPYAFQDCDMISLHKICSSNSEALKYLFSDTFIGCHDLETVILQDDKEKHHFDVGRGAIYDIESRTLIWCFSKDPVFKIIRGTKVIADGALSEHPHRQIIIPNSVEKIGENAFYNGETNYVYEGTQEEWEKINFGSKPNMESITFSDGKVIKKYTNAEIIEDGALIDLVGKTINISKRVKIFKGKQCEGALVQEYYEHIDRSLILYEGTTTDWAQLTFEKYSSNPLGSFGVLWSDCNRPRRRPLSHEVFCEKVSAYAFVSILNMKEVFFAKDLLKEIGSDAFGNSDNLQRVHYDGTIAEWNKVKFADMYANPLSNYADLYLDLVKVETLDLTGIEEITDFAFSGCNSIKKVIISSSMRRIGKSAFWQCWQLTDVYFNGTIDEWLNIRFANEESNPLYNHAFFHLNNELFDTLVINRNIPKYAFYGCLSLNKAVLQNNVEIGKDAFKDCFRLFIVDNQTDMIIAKNEANGFLGNYQAKIEEKGDFKYYVENDVVNIVEYSGKEEILEFSMFTQDIKIGPCAFYHVNTIQEISFSKNVIDVDYLSFLGCRFIFAIYKEEGCKHLSYWHGRDDNLVLCDPKANDCQKKVDTDFIFFENDKERFYVKCLLNEKKIKVLDFGKREPYISSGTFSECDKLETLAISSRVCIDVKALNNHKTLKRIQVMGSRKEFEEINGVVSDYYLNIEFGDD